LRDFLANSIGHPARLGESLSFGRLFALCIFSENNSIGKVGEIFCCFFQRKCYVAIWQNMDWATFWATFSLHK
jgi:hypothetical protein